MAAVTIVQPGLRQVVARSPRAPDIHNFKVNMQAAFRNRHRATSEVVTYKKTNGKCNSILLKLYIVQIALSQRAANFILTKDMAAIPIFQQGLRQGVARSLRAPEIHNFKVSMQAACRNRYRAISEVNPGQASRWSLKKKKR